MAPEVFVLSGDQDETAFIENSLAGRGFEVRSSARLSSALRALKGSELVILSFDGKNVETLREIRSYHPESVVLVSDEPDSMNGAVREGAFDFLEKPLNPVRLNTAVRNAFQYMSSRDELSRLKRTEAPRLVPPRNREMLRVSHQADRAAVKNVPVLLLGETGTGREVIARSIHFNGARAGEPFVQVEAPAAEVAAGLFGTVTSKGVAHGAIMTASGGTVYIEGVDKLEPDIAARLAAFIRDKKFVPEKGSEPLRADVRVICSAHALDAKSPLSKSFRSKISIPPLRRRREDLLPLAEHFLKSECSSLGTGPKRFSKDAGKYVLEHDWPGNAGELKNAVRKACLLSEGETAIERRHLASGGAAYCSVREFLDDKLKGYMRGLVKTGGSGLYDTVTAEVEKALIELALKETGGNQLKASKILGLNRNTLRSKIKLYKIKNGRAAKASKS
ncbi:MAG: sigma 54-interacting transcriptional regulator [Nitrospirota bacterium]|jgi:DNA-binding NtrC family response regulator